MERHINRDLEHCSNDSDIDMDSENRLRISDNSQIAQLDVNTLATVTARECPAISTINIDKSSGVHIGPKIVSVVQNVDNNEKVKGRFLGLELVSLTKRRRRLRCSVAVFLCWAFIVAIILTIFIAYLIMSATPQRLDIGLNETWYLRRAEWQARQEYRRHALNLPVNKVVIGHSAGTFCRTKYQCIKVVYAIQEGHLRIYDDIGPNFLVGDLPLPRYLVSVVKNTSRAERIACITSLVVIVFCISLIVYFVKTSSEPNEEIDVAPHSWNITRDMWLAIPYNNSEDIKEDQKIRLVIINHSMGSECYTFRVCAAELRNLQGYFLYKVGWDIPYNFLVGNEGRIYEGRGWNKVGAHTKSYNRCTLGIGFIGDYRPTSNTHSSPTEAQIERLNMLLSAGVKLGYLHPDYVIVGGKDIDPKSESPGSNLYNEMKKWKHYDNERYRNLTCNEIILGNGNNSTAKV